MAKKRKEFYCFERIATAEHPAGITVSKFPSLLNGDFGITEYLWGSRSLWFVDADNFTADERQAAYESYRLSEAAQ